MSVFKWMDLKNNWPVFVLVFAFFLVLLSFNARMNPPEYDITGKNIDYWWLVSLPHTLTPYEILLSIPLLTLVGLIGFVLTRFKNRGMFIILLFFANGCGCMTLLTLAGDFYYHTIKHLEGFKVDNQIYHLAVSDVWGGDIQYPPSFVVYKCDVSGNYCTYVNSFMYRNDFPRQMNVLPEITVIIDPDEMTCT